MDSSRASRLRLLTADELTSPEIGARSESETKRHVARNSVRRLRRYENQRRR